MSQFLTVVRKARNAPRFLQQKYRQAIWDNVIVKRKTEWSIDISPGVPMLLPTNQAISRGFFVYRGYELADHKFVASFLRESDVFLDIGANIGSYSLLASTCVGSSGAVYSFEPTPETFDTLERSVSMNGMTNISLYRIALGDQVEFLELHVLDGGYSAWNTFAVPQGIYSAGGWHNETVECTTLAVWAERISEGRSIDLIKIDVEGWERRVLLGGRSLLTAQNAPVLLVEFSSGIAAQAGESLADLRETLLSYGYKLYRYHVDSAHGPSLVEEKSLVDSYKCNLVAAKDIGLLSERTKASVA